VVLGSVAAQNLQMYHLNGRALVSIGSTWFTVIGIMGHAALDATLDTDVFISRRMAAKFLKTKSPPTTIYVRSGQNSVTSVSDLLGPTANPIEHQPEPSRPIRRDCVDVAADVHRVNSSRRPERLRWLPPVPACQRRSWRRESDR
jgi:hypothetical protein